MSKEMLIVLSAVVPLLLVLALMWRGWQGKLRRQAGLAELPEVPTGLGDDVISVPGQYVVTTSAGDWLDRVAVHGLGIRTPAVVTVYPSGVVLDRKGATALFISKAALSEVGTQSGMAGKFVEKDGLVVITWHLADTEVDTGFRTTEAGAKRPLVEALQALLPEGSKTESTTENE